MAEEGREESKGEFFKKLKQIRGSCNSVVQDNRGWQFKQAWNSLMVKRADKGIWETWKAPNGARDLNEDKYGPFTIRQVGLPLPMIIGLIAQDPKLSGWYRAEFLNNYIYFRPYGTKITIAYRGHSVYIDLASCLNRQKPLDDLNVLIHVLESCKSEVLKFNSVKRRPKEHKK